MKGGKLDFSGSSLKGIVNHGAIRAVDGDIYMIAHSVENHGTLYAPNGTVGLAAGQSVTLMDSGHPSLKVRPSKNSVGTTGTGIINTGLINAVQVELVAHGNIYALAINNRGTIRATGSVNRDGQVFLVAGRGDKIANSGTIIEVPAGQNPDLLNKLASTETSPQSANNSDNENAMGGNVGTGNEGGGYGNTGPGNQGNDDPDGNAGGNQGGGNQGGGNQGGGNQGGGNQGGDNQGGGNQGGGNQGGGNQGGFGGGPTYDFWQRTELLAESLMEMFPNLPYFIYSEGEQKWPGRSMTKSSSADVFDYETPPGHHPEEVKKYAKPKPW